MKLGIYTFNIICVLERSCNSTYQHSRNKALNLHFPIQNNVYSICIMIYVCQWILPSPPSFSLYANGWAPPLETSTKTIKCCSHIFAIKLWILRNKEKIYWKYGNREGWIMPYSPRFYKNISEWYFNGKSQLQYEQCRLHNYQTITSRVLYIGCHGLRVVRIL